MSVLQSCLLPAPDQAMTLPPGHDFVVTFLKTRAGQAAMPTSISIKCPFCLQRNGFTMQELETALILDTGKEGLLADLHIVSHPQLSIWQQPPALTRAVGPLIRIHDIWRPSQHLLEWGPCHNQLLHRQSCPCRQGPTGDQSLLDCTVSMLEHAAPGSPVGWMHLHPHQ